MHKHTSIYIYILGYRFPFVRDACLLTLIPLIATYTGYNRRQSRACSKVIKIMSRLNYTFLFFKLHHQWDQQWADEDEVKIAISRRRSFIVASPRHTMIATRSLTRAAKEKERTNDLDHKPAVRYNKTCQSTARKLQSFLIQLQ